MTCAYKGYNNAPAWAAGDSLFADCAFWVQGNGGSGNPAGLENPWFRADISNGGVTYDKIWCMLQSSTNASPINEPYSGILRTYPYFWNGAETTRNPFFQIGLKFSGAGSARLIVSGGGS